MFRRLLREECFIVGDNRLAAEVSTASSAKIQKAATLNSLQWLLSREVRMRHIEIYPSALFMLTELYPGANYTRLVSLRVSSASKVQCSDRFSNSVNKSATATSVVTASTVGTITTSVPDIDNDRFQKLLIKCSDLRELMFESVAYYSFGKVGMLCPKLQAISVSGCDGFNDTAMESIAEHCTTALRFVSIGNCSQLTSASVLSLAANCSHMVHLDISYCLAFTERSLLQLSTSCPLLQHLNCECLTNVTDEVIDSFARHCPLLQHVNIDYCKGSMRGGISPITLRTLLEHCPQLEAYITLDFNYRINRQGRSTLRLKGSYFHQHEMVEIFNNCPSTLNVLNAIECRKFGDICLAAAASRFGLHLQVLQARHSIYITDAGLTAFAAQCPQLASLDISSSAEITDSSLTALATDCPRLRCVFISSCCKISDAGVAALVAQCSELQVLDLSSCQQLTDASIDALSAAAARSSESLRYIDISGCSRLSDRAVAEMTAASESLRGLRLHSNNQAAAASISYYRDRYPQHLSLGFSRSEWMKAVTQLL